MKKILVCCIGLYLALYASAQGAQPLEEIRKPIDQIIQILKDLKYQEPAQKTVQREKIREIVTQMFDFREISMRTLATYWKDFSAEQQKEFTEVFSEFLGNIYLDRVQGEFRNEKVIYIGQELDVDTKSVVKTKIVRENGIEIPVDYSLRKGAGGWRIYDVNIEGVSLVKNYRSQFREILLKEKPDKLIGILKDKVQKQRAKTSSSATRFRAAHRLAQAFGVWHFIAQKFLLAAWVDPGHLKRLALR